MVNDDSLTGSLNNSWRCKYFKPLIEFPVSFALLSPLLPNFCSWMRMLTAAAQPSLVTEAGSWSVNLTALDKTQSAKICQPFPPKAVAEASPHPWRLCQALFIFSFHHSCGPALTISDPISGIQTNPTSLPAPWCLRILRGVENIV